MIYRFVTTNPIPDKMRYAGPSALLALTFVLLWSPAARADVTQTTIKVGVHGNMQAQLFVPDGPGPHPGLLVLHTSGGLQNADLLAAKQLADQGYVCLVPAFMAAYRITYDSRRDTFARDGDAIFADLVNAIGVLQSNPKVAGAKVGAIGFSNGGYFAVWLALTSQVAAGVSFYGAYSGAGGDPSEARFKKLASSSAAPILILHGQNDNTVPVEAARRLAGILGGVNAPYEMQLYPNTGHSFDRGGSVPPTSRRLGRGPVGSAQSAATGDSDAASDAWTRALTFFAKYLN